jgi:hypothetical protein
MQRSQSCASPVICQPFIVMEIMKTYSPIKSRRSSQKERSVDNLEQGNHQSTSDNIEKKPLKYIGGPVGRGGCKCSASVTASWTHDLISLCIDPSAKSRDRTRVTTQAVKAETPEYIPSVTLFKVD